MRGGGDNFGVVTSFEYQLHPVGPVVLGGALFHTADRAEEFLKFDREWTRNLPDELTTLFALVTAPPEPFIPPPLVGQPLVRVASCYVGSSEAGQALVRPLIDFAPPAVNLLAPIPNTVLQGMFDPGAPYGVRSYWKTAYLDDLTDPAISTLVAYGRVDSLGLESASAGSRGRVKRSASYRSPQTRPAATARRSRARRETIRLRLT